MKLEQEDICYILVEKNSGKIIECKTRCINNFKADNYVIVGLQYDTNEAIENGTLSYSLLNTKNTNGIEVFGVDYSKGLEDRNREVRLRAKDMLFSW